MTSTTELNELVAAGLFGDAAKRIDKQQELTTAIRVLRAQLEAHVGTPGRARELAEQLLTEKLTHSEKCHCWALVGRVCLSVGELNDGMRAMARAFSESNATQDLQVEARLRANYVHALHAWVELEAAALEIPKLRQIAIQAGDAYSIIATHALVASIDARRGHVKSAQASVEIARNLLGRFGNLWLEGRLGVVSYCIAMSCANYEEALHWNRNTLDCARRSGSRELLIPGLGNLALLKASQREFDAAKTALDELNHEIRKTKPSVTEVAVRDIEMLVAIATDDLDRAEELDRHVNALIEGVEATQSYYELWHSLNQVRLLYRKGRPQDGLARAIDSIPKIARMGDPQLLKRMTLLAAEGYGRIGKPETGVPLLATATMDNVDDSLELTAEVFRVAGRLAMHDSSELALEQLDRASRILDGIGSLARKEEVERDRDEILSQKCGPPDDAGNPAPENKRAVLVASRIQNRNPLAPFTERIGALIESGSHAPLLASEILSLLSDTAAVVRAAIFTTHEDNGRTELVQAYGTLDSPGEVLSSSDAVRLEVGNHGKLRYEVVFLPCATASARVTVLAVERLAHTAVSLARARQREREQSSLWSASTPEEQLGLVCASDRMLELIKTIRRVAGTNVTVLLTGETGTGKELFARALHLASSKRAHTFLPFNCTTVPRDMFDSQLFGHKRGSFTGAHEDAPGVIRAAAGGTLFLDEIGELSMDVQPKLLRFLESGEIQPLGDPKPKIVDVRIVAATNAKLDRLVADGRFREDLFYRLNIIRIDIPPLRERREEIPALVEHFLERSGRELQKPMLRLADETLEYLVLYHWPGNVRQLANEIRRMVAMAEPGSVLMPAHLSDDIAASRKTVSASAPPPRQANEIVTRIDQPLSAAVDHIERAAIQRAMMVADGRLDEAAKLLGLSRKGLYLKRQRLGLE